MKRILLLCLLSVIYISTSHGQYVSKDEAQSAAQYFLSGSSTKKSSITIQSIDNIRHQDTTVFYIVRSNNKGSAIVAGDKKIRPVLAYSEENTFSGEITHPGLEDLFEFYKKSIHTIISDPSHSEKNTAQEWEELLESSITKKSTKGVSPMITVSWNQNEGWNKYCPEDAEGPGGRVYAGCVAVSMGQAMSIFEHPARGVGSKSYVSSYGYLTANFGETDYWWDRMLSNQPGNYNAKLLYHCGVAIEMD